MNYFKSTLGIYPLMNSAMQPWLLSNSRTAQFSVMDCLSMGCLFVHKKHDYIWLISRWMFSNERTALTSTLTFPPTSVFWSPPLLCLLHTSSMTAPPNLNKPHWKLRGTHLLPPLLPTPANGQLSWSSRLCLQWLCTPFLSPFPTKSNHSMFAELVMRPTLPCRFLGRMTIPPPNLVGRLPATRVGGTHFAITGWSVVRRSWALLWESNDHVVYCHSHTRQVANRHWSPSFNCQSLSDQRIISD